MPVQDSSQAASDAQPGIEEVDVPEQTTDEVSAETEPQTEQTFTRVDMERLLAEAENRFTRMIQSQVAKSENRTDARIQERLAALDINRAALNLNDEAAYEAAQDAIIRDEQKKAFKQPQRPVGNESQQTAFDLGDAERFVSNQIEQVFKEAGIQVSSTDPEFKLIEQAWNDPKGSLAKTLIATNQAATAKAERLSALKGTAKARVSGSGGSTSDASNISHITDTSALYELGEKRLRDKRK